MQVIVRLKRKMVVTVLAVQAIVFAFILVVLNAAVFVSNFTGTRNALESFTVRDLALLESRQGRQPEWNQKPSFKPPPPRRNESISIHQLWEMMSAGFDHRAFGSVFALSFDVRGGSVSTLSKFPVRYTSEELSEIVSAVSSAGFTDKPRFFLCRTGTFLYTKFLSENGFVVSIADFTSGLQSTALLLLVSGVVYVLACAVSTVVACFLAERSVRPVREAFETQKQFVADAGHELKTPVAVIGANADALSGEIGTNKWLEYIKTEVSRMDSLVSDLLYLAKSDAGRIPFTMCEFDLSRAVEAAVLPFESIVYEQRKVLELDISGNVMYTGDQRRISQVVVILLDNAVKNSPEGARIKVSLRMEQARRGRGGFRYVRMVPVVAIFNEGEGLSPDDMNRVFQRFYRVDTSRTRETGGSGLGLSIAETIARAHNGAITVEGEYGRWVSFSLHLGVAHLPQSIKENTHVRKGVPR